MHLHISWYWTEYVKFEVKRVDPKLLNTYVQKDICITGISPWHEVSYSLNARWREYATGLAGNRAVITTSVQNLSSTKLLNHCDGKKKSDHLKKGELDLSLSCFFCVRVINLLQDKLNCQTVRQLLMFNVSCA